MMRHGCKKQEPCRDIDRGQASGEVATDGRPKTVRVSDGIAPATISDLGVSRQRVSEWREMRDAGGDR